MVELLLPKQVVVGSIPITRSKPQTTLPALAGGSCDVAVRCTWEEFRGRTIPASRDAEYGLVRTDSSEWMS